MPRLVWDEQGKRYYETGVDRGVLYVMSQSAYATGVVWNGLTNVTESPSGAEPNPQYADNIKYLNLVSDEQFGGTIEAFTYPDEWEKCDGSINPSAAPGLYITGQNRAMFGLSYRTKIGNDTEGLNKGYKLHLVYGGSASPAEKSRNTVNENPEALKFSWKFTTVPVPLTGYKPTAHLVIDSTKTDSETMKKIEDILYGTDSEGTGPRLPLPDEVITLLTPVM